MKITLYGAGYIGHALLPHFSNHEVTIITRTHHPEHALFPHLSYEKNSPEEIARNLSTAECIICTVAPHNTEYNLYTETATFLTKVAPKAYFIYTSSIGVYGDVEGIITEETSCLPTSDRSKYLYQAETLFLKTKNACIFRLGGIYGPDRCILEILQNRGKITGSKVWPTNMIHRDDVIQAILFAFIKKLKGIYNLVDCEHPTREELYTQLAEAKEMPLPYWDESQPNIHGGNRCVSNKKLLREGFHFIHPVKEIRDL